jgi:hypothetical protein
MTDSEKFVITSEQMLGNMIEQIASMYVDHGWLTVEVKAGNRTLSQNSLYWMWMSQLADRFNGTTVTYYDEELGKEVTQVVNCTKKHFHNRMRKQFLGFDVTERVGTMLVEGQLKSTAEMTKGQMFHYMELIDMYWASLGVLLVTPDDSVYAQLKRKHNG